MSKIEQIINEIEEYVDSAKFQTLSSTKIVVNKEELLELVDDLRRNVPDEIKKYQRIIANRDAILKDAQDKAEEMIKKANEMTASLVSEHEIMQQAYKEANKLIAEANTQAGGIIDRATEEANEIKVAAIRYTDDSLAGIQDILNTAIENTTLRYDELTKTLESSLEITTNNRKALQNTENAPQDVYPTYDAPEEDVPVYGSNRKYDDMSLEEAYARGEIDAEDEEDDAYGEGRYTFDEITDFSLNVDDFK